MTLRQLMGPDCFQVFRGDTGITISQQKSWRRYCQLALSVFIKGRSMDMSVISPFNVLEKAREMKSEVFLSSGDITKEFRYRVPTQAQVWTYARLGSL